MTSIASVILEVPDAAAATTFYANAFGLGDQLRVRESDAPTSGFRGYTLSLVVSQPANVDALMNSALEAGATAVKPAAKSFWGYGGSLRTPDGSIWTLASSSKKNTRPASREIDSFVLLLGVEDMAATKKFYVDHGLVVGKSFGSKYTEFKAPEGKIQLALNGRKSLAKNAGVPPEGSGSHRIIISGDGGSFTDPEGFTWESA